MGETRGTGPGDGQGAADALDLVAERATSGDRSAWARVWTELSPRVHGYLRMAGASDPDAMTSDVFVTLIQRDQPVRGGWQGLCSLAFTVAHARVVDDLRRRSVRRTTALEPEDDPRRAPSAESAALAAEGDALTLLPMLDEQERAVLTLRYVADLDLAQTATVLGLSAATVSRVQARALAHLRALLAPRPTESASSKGPA